MTLMILTLALAAAAADGEYQPTKKSVSRHPVPEWYNDAKFGIMIHWGLYSVPAFAPTGAGDINQVMAKHGLEYQFKNNPYAEWYWNSLRLDGSAVRAYHDQTYGPDFPYPAFAPEFNREAQSWDPDAWAQAFADAGARYAVLVTKHHDGFVLWPSATPSPNLEGWRADRDVVGEFAAAVRNRGLRLGLYYSGALDWSFNPKPISSFATFLDNGPTSKEYADYVEAHFRELIDRYHPDVLWNDIGYPPAGDLYGLIAYFYNQTPEGAVNDRWMRVPIAGRKFVNARPVSWVLDRISRLVVAGGGMPSAPTAVSDFATPEYRTSKKILKHKWESVRGIGLSFGYNRIETDADYLAPDAAVQMLVDIVSKNGNLLLNVGPRADGSIPEAQLRVLRALGAWLKPNGEAIFGTRPWRKAETQTGAGLEVRFTHKPDALYAIILGAPEETTLVIKDLRVPPAAAVSLLDGGAALEWRQRGPDLEVALPAPLPPSPAHVLVISPPPSS